MFYCCSRPVLKASVWVFFVNECFKSCNMYSYGRYFFARIIFFIRLFLQYRNIICLLVNYRPNKICNCFSGIRLFYVFNECHDLWRALLSNKNNSNRKFNTKLKLSLLLKERWKLLNILLLGCRCSRS